CRNLKCGMSRKVKAPVSKASQPEVLLTKLEPLLRTLEPEELADLPVAAEKLASRPRGARSVLYPHPAQPVEAVVARGNREVVGVLLLRRKWIERAIDANADASSLTSASSRKASAVADWLNDFGRTLGQLLVTEIEFLDAGLYWDEPELVLAMVERYAEE